MSDAARRALLGILIFGLLGITAELLLMNHIEGVRQIIPVALAGLALVSSGVVAARPSRASVRVFQVVMLMLIVSGVVGMYLHFQVNMEFQLEMDSTLTGWPLLRKSILAKTPPALAPGAMMQLGLIGLAYTFGHPGLGGERR